MIAAVLCACANALVAVDAQLHPRIVPHDTVAPLLMSLVSGWVRERSDSVWPSVIGHNLSNLVLPGATICSALAH